MIRKNFSIKKIEEFLCNLQHHGVSIVINYVDKFLQEIHERFFVFKKIYLFFYLDLVN